MVSPLAAGPSPFTEQWSKDSFQAGFGSAERSLQAVLHLKTAATPTLKIEADCCVESLSAYERLLWARCDIRFRDHNVWCLILYVSCQSIQKRKVRDDNETYE